MRKQAATKRREVLLGKLSHDVLTTVDLWRQPSSKLIVFVSSTFTDTDRERNILLEKILPDLREQGRTENIEVVFVDMRWGVRDENTLDHQTWIACKRELLRCWKESAGLFFLSLQSDKYGYRPLPRTLSKVVVESALAAAASDAERDLAREWYILDDNAVGGQYVLKSLTSLNDTAYWETALPTLRDGLLAGAEIGEGSDLVVGQSVTEWEARCALALSAGEAGYWLHRTFEYNMEADDRGGKRARKECVEAHTELAESAVDVVVDDVSSMDPSDTTGLNVVRESWLDDGEKDRLGSLKDHMRRVLGPAKKIEDATVTVASYLAKDDAWWSYIADFESRARTVLGEEMERVMEAKRQWAVDGYGVGVPGDELAEVLHHVQWACQKISDFEGRKDELSKALSLVLAPSPPERGGDELQGVCLVLVGKSGAGKTASMAKLAQLINNERPDRPVLIRFCGTSKGSMTGLALLQSLCHQIEHIFQLAPTLPADYKGWVARFHSLLAAHSVVLVIDSLDQLSDDNDARSSLTFLRGLVPHPDTRVIVSCLPDETDTLTGKRYFYGCETRLRESKVARVDIRLLVADGAIEMVRQLLARKGRILTTEQWRVIGSSVGDESTALYCHLAVRVAATWSSSTALHQCVLPPTVPAIIHLILDGIELEFGREWTRVALAVVTYSSAGISDGEMQDILSLEDERVLDHVFQYSKPDDIRRFPLHVWLRLKGALEGLLVEREHGCFQWYHRQLSETAEERYGHRAAFAHSCEKQLAHELMAKYFGDLCGHRGTERLVTKQPLSLNGKSVWESTAQVNLRRCTEFPFQVVAAGKALVEEACSELCRIHLVCACAKAGQGFELLKALLALDRATGGRVERLTHYVRWLLNDTTEMSLHPQHQVAETCFKQPLKSSARRDLEGMIDNAENHSMQHMSAAEWRCAWVVGMPLGGRLEFDSCRMTLRGHSEAVNAVSISRCGRFLASASGDLTVRVWDCVSGDCLAILLGHTDSVTSVVFVDGGANAGSQLLVSGSRDWTLRVWDMETRGCLAVWRGHTNNVNAVTALSERLVCSGSGDKTLRIWDLASGVCVSCLEGHSQYVVSVAVGVRDSGTTTILSGSGDSTVRLWNSSSGELVKTLSLHSAPVRSVAWKESDYSRFASGSEDWTARVWCAQSLECLFTLQGHSGGVRCVAWSAPTPLSHVAANASSRTSDLAGQDDVLLTGSYDSTLRTWSGEKCTAVLTGHTGYVLAAAYSPTDGCRLVSGSVDCTVRVYDSSLVQKQGKGADVTADTPVVPHPISSTGNALALAVSPDCRFVACSSCREPAVRVWSAMSGECTGTLLGAEALGTVITITWSNDDDKGRFLVAGTSDALLMVWDARVSVSRELLKKKCHDGPVTTVSVTRPREAKDQQYYRIATGSEDKSVKVWAWDAAVPGACFCLATLSGHSAVVKTVSFADTSGDKVLSGSWDNTLRVICWKSETCLLTLQGHTACVNAVACSPLPLAAYNSSLIASGGMDGTVRVWRETDGTCLGVLRGHTNLLLSLAWSPDGRVLCSSAGDKTVWLWDVVLLVPLQTLLGHSSNVLSIQISQSFSNMRIVSAAQDNSVRVHLYHMHDDATATPVMSGSCECSAVVHGRIGSIARSVAVAFRSSVNQIVTSTGENLVQIWGSSSAVCHHELDAHTDYVVSVAVSGDGSWVYSGSGDKTVRVWSIRDGGSCECVSVLAGHTAKVTSVACDTSGSLVISGSLDGTVRVWDHNQCLAVLEHNRRTVCVPRVDGTEGKGEACEVLSVAVSRDGRRIASGGSDFCIRLYEPPPPVVSDTGEGGEACLDKGHDDRWDCVAFLEGHSGWVYTLSFDVGSRLVSGSADSTLKIWECAVDTSSTPSLRSSLKGHTSAVRAVAWSPNSSVIVSGSEDHTLIVWEAKNGGHPVCLTTVHTNTFLYIVSLSWIPDGSGVVTTCGDNSVRIWRALAHEFVCGSVFTNETD